MDRDKAEYVFRYYAHLMTKQESLAYRHLLGTAKATHGRTDEAAQAETRDNPRHFRELLSNDPEVLSFTREGFEPFLMRTAERIFNAHQNEILLNCCPKCGALAKTPKARQCRFCRHDWH
jgi:hypothetical protein